MELGGCGEAHKYCDGDGGRTMVRPRGGPVGGARFGQLMGKLGGGCLAGGGRGLASGSGGGVLGDAVANIEADWGEVCGRAW